METDKHPLGSSEAAVDFWRGMEGIADASEMFWRLYQNGTRAEDIAAARPDALAAQVTDAELSYLIDLGRRLPDMHPDDRPREVIGFYLALMRRRQLEAMLVDLQGELAGVEDAVIQHRIRSMAHDAPGRLALAFAAKVGRETRLERFHYADQSMLIVTVLFIAGERRGQSSVVTITAPPCQPPAYRFDTYHSPLRVPPGAAGCPA